MLLALCVDIRPAEQIDDCPATGNFTKKKPRVPAGVRIYAVGDIHGRAIFSTQLLKRIDADLEQNPVSVGHRSVSRRLYRSWACFAGGYRSTGGSATEHFGQFFSKATTRAILLSFTANPLILDEWQQFGGLETLRSYGIVPSINIGADAQARLAATFWPSVAGQPPYDFSTI